MKIAEIVAYLESVAPPSLQESYDNAGLITGDPAWVCTGAIISLDATEEVMIEAIEKKCNLVISHHPIVFRGLRKITNRQYADKAVIAAIKNDIAIFAIHTNLDNVLDGVNGMIAARLGLVNTRILVPRPGTLQKLCVCVPVAQAEAVRAAIFRAGAGNIGRYSECSFNTPGKGTFTAGAGTHPFSGEVGKPHEEDEMKIETVFPAWLQPAVVKAMKEAHPYEEVAYDILPLENAYERVGAGIVGELSESVEENIFLQRVKDVFRVPVVRHSRLTGKQVRRVAVCGGAGSFLVPNALQANADVYVTADMKYHEFFDANGRMVIADPGHYETEQFTIELLAGLMREKFPTFAALKTEIYTNPVRYFL